MRTRYRSSSVAGSGALAALGCSFWLFILGLNVTVGALCVQYVVSFWTQYFMHVAKHVPFIVAALVSVVVEVSIPAAIITWLCSFILGTSSTFFL